MAKRNTSIQINGKHYDALTGALLSSKVVSATKSVKTASKSIDGVVAGTVQTAKRVAPAPQPIVVKPTAPAKPAVARAAAAHVKAHHVKPSATLMRHAVKKPTHASLKRHTKVQTPTHHAKQLAAVRHLAVQPKLSLYTVNQQRADRAKQVAKSPRVGRFAHELAVTLEHDVQTAAVAINKAIIIPQTAMPSGAFQPVLGSAPRQSKPSDIFEQALLRATSHEEPAPNITTKKGRRAMRLLRRRMVSFSAGAVAVLAIIGVFGFQNESVQFKMATKEAGFSATMPGYQPAGFEVDDVSVNSGYVNVRYHNPSLNRSFAVTEKPSNLNSESLLSQITSSRSSSTYSTVKHAGRTIYVYGKNQAAWVHNGILYQVLGNGALGTKEFVAIAASM